MKNKNYSEGGCYGSYYKLSKYRGIKLLFKEFQTIEKLKNSIIYKKAKKECKILKTLTKRKCNFTPKCYGLKIIKFDNHYRIGIILKDLGNTSLFNIDKIESNEKNRMIRNFGKELRQKYKIINKDIHDGNIMFYKGKFWVIDFTPSYCKIL